LPDQGSIVTTRTLLVALGAPLADERRVASRLWNVFLTSFACGYWQANCYVVAAAGVDQCVIIDPGQDSADLVRRVVADNRLVPRAILLTHGHFDHAANAAQLADEFDVAVHVDAADEHLLSDPAAGLSPDGAALVRRLVGESMLPPARVENYKVDQPLSVAHLDFSVTAAPGHTGGSVLLGIDYVGNPQIKRLVFCGDVVFADSVGRSDLPGGDDAAMRRTLSRVVLALPDTAALLPGHGQQTTMARERVSNPYLQATYLRN
jgi:glyoxylase-like metal-dependent hydrolase (beta-lactamase superfamily II)